MKAFIFPLYCILILSPFCLSKLRNLSSPVIITELVNSNPCTTFDKTFSIIFSNPPSESFTEKPKVVLYSNKNGYLNATCKTTINEFSLECEIEEIKTIILVCLFAKIGFNLG